MGTAAKIVVIILALSMIFAIKPYYGGEITLRLNEPPGFAYTPSDFSNLVFYSLLYENLFYLKSNGEIFSNVFRYYKYDAATYTLSLDLRENISFSNGDAVTGESVELSLNLFLENTVDSSLRLRQVIKNIQCEDGRVTIGLQYDKPDVVNLLAAPELVLLSGSGGVFSGMFQPVEWEKGKFIRLSPNKYYPGGRTYLESVKVLFYDFYYPDIFLSGPGLNENGFREYNAGIYQNIYIVFPGGKVGTNTRLALYSLLREFAKSIDMTPLNVLTSEEESPITLNIKKLYNSRVRSILRRSRIKLYIVSSLKQIEEKLVEFLKKKRLPISPIFVSDSQLETYLSNAGGVDYLMMVKVFNKRMPQAEKIKKIIKEMSFSRFDENYLKLLSQLEEVRALKNEELLLEQVAGLIEKVVGDGFLLPLFQKRYSLYVKEEIKGLELDYFGRPLFTRMRSTADNAEPGAAGNDTGGKSDEPVKLDH
ncbi:MAG: hypothetical protein GY765_36075 [bacterium]|nr:hypothetical protein [bacterium]